ncbi:hypothetical protein H6G06_26690, partial [Anabaena sphaerica FACHB-251]|nr:hypothetical protein [Anabaena sphaerica FACHB-251]
QPQTEISTNTVDEIAVQPQLPTQPQTEISTTVDEIPVQPKLPTQPQPQISTNTVDEIAVQPKLPTQPQPQISTNTVDEIAVQPKLPTQPQTEISTNTVDKIPVQPKLPTQPQPQISTNTVDEIPVQPQLPTQPQTEISTTVDEIAVQPKLPTQPQTEISTTVDEIAVQPKLPTQLQPQISTTVDEIPVQPKLPTQPQPEISIDTVDEIPVQPQLSSQPQTSANTVDEIPVQQQLQTQSQTSANSVDEISVQPQLQTQNISSIKPLGQQLPLGKKSDFLFSPVVTHFLENPNNFTSKLTKEPEIFSPIQLFKKDNSIQNEQFGKENKNPPSYGNITESWSSIDDLLSLTSDKNDNDLPSMQSLDFTNYFLAEEKLKSKNNQFNVEELPPSEVEKRDNNAAHTSNVESNNTSSSSSELRDENLQKSADNSKIKEDESTNEPLVSIEQPQATSSSNFAINDEDLEALAQYIYTILRQKLQLEQERQGNKLMGNPVWMSNFTSSHGTYAKYNLTSHTANSEIGKVGTLEKMNEASLLDNRLQALSNEVYIMLKRRFEIERELQGNYYTGRINW